MIHRNNKNKAESKNILDSALICKHLVAERMGFDPMEGIRPQRFSKPTQSV